METYHEMIAAERKDYEAKRDELVKQLAELKQKFDDKRRVINDLCNHPTKHSIAAKRKADAYRMRRVLGGTLSEWQNPYLNGADSTVNFNMEDDKIVFNITVPFIHSAYEDELDLF